ncbi:copper amine oxidase N-terminal domain-containing protein [uncultured Peptoniphilus sp.]|uniref:copper amine oxidase N-terminal domain-containing protein n=1 Tax=uncultured Peptoniphilus sp. TaxID=254354 RepID=UPI002805F8BE|nr:copper amine oxidase N-terminal domain-containing protein [uncultured Peptoniphilus sp.]
MKLKLKKIFNSRILFSIVFIAVLITGAKAQTQQEFTITINNKQVQLSDYLGRPYIENDRTMVPLRVVSENMGFKVDWEEKGQIIYVENKALGRKLIFIIGENVATLNDKPKFIDENKSVTPVLKDNRTYIPLRFVAENMGYNVDYKQVKGHHYIDITLGNDKPVAGKDLNQDELLNLFFSKIYHKGEVWGRPGDNDAIVNGRMSQVISTPPADKYPGKVSANWVTPEIRVGYEDPFVDEDMSPFHFYVNNKAAFKNAPDDWTMSIELIDPRFYPYNEHIEAKKSGHKDIINGKFMGKYGGYVVGNKLSKWSLKDTSSYIAFDDLFQGNPNNYNYLKTKDRNGELLAPPLGDVLRYRLKIQQGNEVHGYEFDVRYMMTLTQGTLDKIKDPKVKAGIEEHFKGNELFNDGVSTAIGNVKQLY